MKGRSAVDNRRPDAHACRMSGYERPVTLDESERRDLTSEPRSATLGAVGARRRRLRSAMDRLEWECARPMGSGRWLFQVEAALRDLRAALADHVAETEAADGLLAEVLEIAPRLGAAVKAARSEHVSLLRSVDRLLLETSDPAGVTIAALRRHAIMLLGQLTQHRQRGADLLYEAYAVDIGSAG